MDSRAVASMELWHLFLLAHLGLIAIAEGVSKYFIHKIKTQQVLFYQYLTSTTLIPIIYFVTRKPDFNSIDIPWIYILFGSIFSLGVLAFYNAKQESLSKSTIMKKAATGVSVLLLVLFVGEYSIINPSTVSGRTHLLGLFLIGIAAYLLYHKKTHEGSEKSFNHTRWVKWITLFILITGAAHPTTKYMLRTYDPLLLLSLQYIGSFLTISLYCAYKKTAFRVQKRNAAGSLILGIFTSLGVATFYSALAVGSGTQILGIRSIALPIISIFIGIIFFKEKFTKRMYLPLALAILAIYLLH